MEGLRGKTVRFSKVVEECGQPEVLTLWTKPDRDAAFQKALREERLMTLHQENTGTRADFGTIGYAREQQGVLFVFPKSLRKFKGQRVVGVKYDLTQASSVAESDRFVPHNTPRGKDASRTRKQARPNPKAIPHAKRVALKRFEVIVRSVSRVEMKQAVEAASAREARPKALQSIRNRPLDFSTGKRTDTVVAVRAKGHLS